MHNLFRDKEKVIVNGYGKCDDRYYKNIKAIIICRDPYYLDYNIRLENGEEDWIDGKYLEKLGE